jgi:RNA polymerase sigma factor (TIGR02999 family)
MSKPSAEKVSQLLVDWSNGDKAVLDQLMPVVYDELHRMAHHYMRGERAGHTLQTSALINEAYLRLIDYRKMRWENRAHFFAICAQLMRRILVEHARSRQFRKRGGGAYKVRLDEEAVVSPEPARDLIALHDALTNLATNDPRKSEIVELRYFGGFSIEETAEFLGLSPTTVKREWRSAKAWLYRAITKGASDEA